MSRQAVPKDRDSFGPRRECRFCGGTLSYIRMVGGTEAQPGKSYAFVQCANGQCGASGPVRESPYAALKVWNRPLPSVWSAAPETASED